MEKKQTSAVMVGLIISLVLIVLSLVLYFTDLYTATWSQYIGFAVLVGGIIWGVVNHGREREHRVGFGNLFGFGFRVTAVIICLMIAYTLLSTFIFPDIKEKVIEIARQQALDNPAADAAQVEAGMEMFAKNYNLFMVLTIVFWYMVIGAIASVVGAAVTKKNQQAPIQNV